MNFRSNLPAPAELAKTGDIKPMLTGAALKVENLTYKLIDLISQETSLLEKRQHREAQKLHGEKNKTINEYQEALSKLHHAKSTLGEGNSPQKLYIRKITDTLRDVIRDHARIVLRLKTVAEGLVRSVTEEVTNKERPVRGYGRNASFVPQSPARPTSLAINQLI